MFIRFNYDCSVGDRKVNGGDVLDLDATRALRHIADGQATLVERDVAVPAYATDSSGNVTGLVGPDGGVIQTISGGIRAIIIGDSRTQQNIDQSTTLVANRARWFTTGNALLGQRFELVNNAGVNGDTAAGVLARINSSNLGVGFGAIGDAATAATTSPGAGLAADWVFLNIGANDIVGTGISGAATWAITKQICVYIIGTGKQLVLCTVMAPNSAIAGYTNAKMRELTLYNDLIRDYCKANRGVYLLDHFAAAISPSSAVIETAATDLRDGTNHENNRGGYKIAKFMQSLLTSIIPPRQGLLPSSNAATSALDASINQLQVNPLLTGTAAITTTGYTGSCAGSNLTNANFVRGGTGSAVLSAVTRSDGFGQNTKFVCTFGAANDSVEMRMPSYHAQAVVGGKYYAVAEVSYTGPAGAALAAADNLRSVQLYIQYNDGTTNYFSYDLGTLTTDTALIGSDSMVLKTPVFTLPSGGTPTTFRVNFTITANGAGSPEVQIGRIGFYRIS